MLIKSILTFLLFIYCNLAFSVASYFCEFGSIYRSITLDNTIIINRIKAPRNFYLTLLGDPPKIGIIDDKNSIELTSLKSFKEGIILQSVYQGKDYKIIMKLGANKKNPAAFSIEDVIMGIDTKTIERKGFCSNVNVNEIYSIEDFKTLMKYKYLDQIIKYYSKEYFTFWGRIKIKVMKKYSIFNNIFSVDDEFKLNYYQLYLSLYNYNKFSNEKLSFNMSVDEFTTEFNKELERTVKALKNIRVKN